jgi:hypothetical protein
METGRSGLKAERPRVDDGCPRAVRSLSGSCRQLVPGCVRHDCRQGGVLPGYNANVVVSMERDWHAIERAYVFGEVVRVCDDGSQERIFPSIRAIAQRFGISRSIVGAKALRNDWVSRRFYFRAALRDATWKKQMADEVARAASPPRAR